jgi:hypothetical protein
MVFTNLLEISTCGDLVGSISVFHATSRWLRDSIRSAAGSYRAIESDFEHTFRKGGQDEKAVEHFLRA